MTGTPTRLGAAAAVAAVAFSLGGPSTASASPSPIRQLGHALVFADQTDGLDGVEYQTFVAVQLANPPSHAAAVNYRLTVRAGSATLRTTSGDDLATLAPHEHRWVVKEVDPGIRRKPTHVVV